MARRPRFDFGPLRSWPAVVFILATLLVVMPLAWHLPHAVTIPSISVCLVLLGAVRRHGIRVVQRQLRDLTEAISQTAWGSGVPVPGDSLASLVSTFDAMADRLADHHAERTAAFDLVTKLVGCDSEEEVFRVLKRTLRRVFPHEGGSVYVKTPGVDAYLRRASWRIGDDAAAFQSDDCAAAGRQPERRCSHTHGRALCFALEAGPLPLGVLSLRLGSRSFDPDGRISHRTLLLGEKVAQHIGLVLQIIQLRGRLQSLSLRDPLTGLYNRRFLDESAERELASALRAGTPLAVVAVDLDHFKRINDNWGHAAGDAVLRETGRVLAAHVRASDIVCRSGGEEFIVLMPGASAAVAIQRAEAMRGALKNLLVEVGPDTLSGLSASAGVAVLHEHGRDVPVLFAAADEALYAAKHAGRDRVCVAPVAVRRAA